MRDHPYPAQRSLGKSFQSPSRRAVRASNPMTIRQILFGFTFQSPSRWGGPCEAKGYSVKETEYKTFNPLVGGAVRARVFLHSKSISRSYTFNPLVGGAVRARIHPHQRTRTPGILFQSPSRRGGPCEHATVEDVRGKHVFFQSPSRRGGPCEHRQPDVHRSGP